MEESRIVLLERLRKKILFYYVLLIAFVIVFFVSMGIFYIPLLVCSLVFGVLFYFMVIRKAQKEYKSCFKNEFIGSVIKSIVPDATYEPKKGFSSLMVSKSGLVMMGNIYNSEDYIRGSYNNVAFERSDVLIQQRVKTGKSTTTITYLRGRWMIFESNKAFTADLQIVEKGASFARTKKGLFTKKSERRHVIKTEDEKFNKAFTCLCQDDSEALYLLTPGVMQSIMNLKQTMDGKLIIGFVDNRIHVIVYSNKDSFEPSFFRKTNFTKTVEATRKEIHMITSFVEELKLDRKIFI